MKKIYIHIMMLAAMVVAGAAMTSCQKEEVATGKFSMTVNATKGGSNAKYLDLDGHTLNATWAAGEQVTVYNETRGAALEGYLEAQSDGDHTTLDGTITGTIGDNDVLTLKFRSPNYDGQDGTLEYIANNCDYATATVTVTSVSGGKITAGNANFVNQQAIVKFTLLKAADNNAFNVTTLTVNDVTNDNDYTVTPAAATNVLFVAIPATDNVSLSTTVGDFTYSLHKSGAGLTAGQYYEIGAKMWRVVNLASLGDSYTAMNGDMLTGTLGGNYKISIDDRATVTLDGVNITNLGNDCDWAGINCPGDATIILKDGSTNTVCAGRDGSGYNNYPGIWIAPDKKLTIKGGGQLTAYSDNTDPYGAGIGGGFGIDCGNIVIAGGTITATGGESSAGIGGSYGSCGNISITGGTVTANGGGNAAGIGGGRGSCGNISITGGTITAQGGMYAAGIGSGYYGSCGTVTITNGVTSVTATKGNYANYSIGAGMGGTCGTVTVMGNTGAIETSPYTYPQN